MGSVVDVRRHKSLNVCLICNYKKFISSLKKFQFSSICIILKHLYVGMYKNMYKGNLIRNVFLGILI